MLLVAIFQNGKIASPGANRSSNGNGGRSKIGASS
jgi:hypothetical protein